MHILFLSCLKATELIEKRLHFKLVWHETLQLKIHKMMCDACKTYEKQSIFLDQSIAKRLKIDVKEQMDIESLKEEIHRSLEKNKH